MWWREAMKRRKERARIKSAQRQTDRLMLIYKIMDRYEEAYRAAIGVACRCEYGKGFVEVYIGTRLTYKARVKEMERMAEQLWAQQHENELNYLED